MRRGRSCRVIDMPAEIDSASVGHLGALLASAIVPAVSVVVADLTGTTFCDVAGARMFAVAHMRAAENGTVLRLVVPAASVRRLFELVELDRLLPIYQGLSAALAPEIEASP